MFQWYLRVWSYIRLFITYGFIHCWGSQRWLYCQWGAAWVGKAMNTLLPQSQPYKENPQYRHKLISMCSGERTEKPTGPKQYFNTKSMLAGTLYLYCTASDNQVLTIMIYQLGISVQQKHNLADSVSWYNLASWLYQCSGLSLFASRQECN